MTIDAFLLLQLMGRTEMHTGIVASVGGDQEMVATGQQIAAEAAALFNAATTATSHQATQAAA